MVPQVWLGKQALIYPSNQWGVRVALGIPDIHVVAGVMQDDARRVLVTRRPDHKLMGGAWEFPGGKLHIGEGRLAGLARELHEELGIGLESARPLIRYRYRYPELEVDLDVWRIQRWSGEPDGLEGQEIEWHLPERLPDVALLPADGPAVNAIKLPALCLVTLPRANRDEACLPDKIEQVVRENDVGLICLRRFDLGPDQLLALAGAIARRVRHSGALLLVHGDPSALAPLLAGTEQRPLLHISGTSGLHMPARCLATVPTRPIPKSLWLGASCHDAKELASALAIGVDYAFLGPVKETGSHPGQPGMGWDKFESLVRDLPLPVYAIGGLGPEDLEDAWEHGAQGIAAIRSLWPG
jgi:8-oxo-dGTP diphosphatase